MTVEKLTYRQEQEIANAIWHGLGILLSIVGFPILIEEAMKNEKTGKLQLIGLALYGMSLLMVYSASTIYHSISQPKIKHIFKVLDHICIYFLIVGTNTPFVLYYLNNQTGYIYLGIMWSMVLIGSGIKLFYVNKYNVVSTIVYAFMGWMAAFIMKPLLETMSVKCLHWILIGGFFYSLGIVFYLWKKYKYHHAVWHILVILGSIGHFIALLYAVNPNFD